MTSRSGTARPPRDLPRGGRFGAWPRCRTRYPNTRRPRKGGRTMRRDPMDLIYLLGMFGPVIVLLFILLAR
ncbi:hypothetical protein ACWCXH_35800 [Kitasatospora sp. NPDC001660]